MALFKTHNPYYIAEFDKGIVEPVKMIQQFAYVAYVCMHVKNWNTYIFMLAYDS